MRMIFDPKLVTTPDPKDFYAHKAGGGHCFIGNSLVDYLDKAIQGNKEAKGFKIIYDDFDVKINYPGRKAIGWDQARELLNQPWPEATSVIDRFVEEISKHPLPEPTDIKRKNKWNPDEGEIDVQRAMKGEADMYRKGFRNRVKGPSQIVLLANLDCPGLCNQIGVFFRSIVTIVLADVLESKGYGVEVWAWCAGQRVFAGPNHYQFNALQCKRSDQPLDKDTLCNVLSAWFTRYAIWASWNYQASPVSIGGMIAGLDIGRPQYYLPEKQPHALRCMMKHIEPEESNAQIYMVPQIWGSDLQMKMVTEKVSKTRRVKGPDGHWLKNEKGRFVREKYEATIQKTVSVPASLNQGAIQAILKVCRDILTAIIQRESE